MIFPEGFISDFLGRRFIVSTWGGPITGYAWGLSWGVGSGEGEGFDSEGVSCDESA